MKQITLVIPDQSRGDWAQISQIFGFGLACYRGAFRTHSNI